VGSVFRDVYTGLGETKNGTLPAWRGGIRGPGGGAGRAFTRRGAVTRGEKKEKKRRGRCEARGGKKDS